MEELLQKIYDQHDVVCNQKYGNYLPYSFHLKAVVAQAEKYSYLLKDKDEKVVAIVGAAGHDLIEDARMTFNDVKELVLNNSFLISATQVADIVYCCTENKGRNRDERHSDLFFYNLKQNRLAVYDKLCDIKANVLFSMLTNSTMYNKYNEEFDRLRYQLYIEGEYEPIWNDLTKLLR